MIFENGETYAGLELQGESLQSGRLRLVELRDSRMVDCDLSNAEWDRLRLVRVTLERCRLTGLRILHGRGSRVTFLNCQARYLQLEQCRWTEARFQDCQLMEASVLDCDLGGAVFRDCDLTGSVVSRSRLHGADIRGCDTSGLRAGVDDLAGAILDAEQAAALLRGQANIHVLPLGVDVGTAARASGSLPVEARPRV
jgi:uncharacterized protein YjbI with pentapeptide repeats